MRDDEKGLRFVGWEDEEINCRSLGGTSSRAKNKILHRDR